MQPARNNTNDNCTVPFRKRQWAKYLEVEKNSINKIEIDSFQFGWSCVWSVSFLSVVVVVVVVQSDCARPFISSTVRHAGGNRCHHQFFRFSVFFFSICTVHGGIFQAIDCSWYNYHCALYCDKITAEKLTFRRFSGHFSLLLLLLLNFNDVKNAFFCRRKNSYKSVHLCTHMRLFLE